jgi:recombination protein RecA
MYGEGISREGDLLDLGVELKLVQKSGAWYSYAGERIGQGRENAKEYLRTHPQVFAEVEARLREMLVKPAGGALERPE